jgi:hypothetical protein
LATLSTLRRQPAEIPCICRSLELTEASFEASTRTEFQHTGGRPRKRHYFSRPHSGIVRFSPKAYRSMYAANYFGPFPVLLAATVASASAPHASRNGDGQEELEADLRADEAFVAGLK